MEFQEPFPSTMNVRQLEQVGFSSEQVASLFSVKALYQRERSIIRPIMSISGKRLSASSTSKVACKAKLRSRLMCEGRYGERCSHQAQASLSLI